MRGLTCIALVSVSAFAETPSLPPISVLAHTPVPVCVHPDVPKELHFGKEQGKRYADEEMNEFTALGYEKRMPYRAGHSFVGWIKYRNLHKKRLELFRMLPNGQRSLSYPGLASYVPNLKALSGAQGACATGSSREADVRGSV